MRITATLDKRSLHKWIGPATSLSLAEIWSALPQPKLFLGTGSVDCYVSAVKVKRLNQ